MRYLGGHLSTTMKMKKTTIEQRWADGMLQLKRLRYTAANEADKVKAMLAKVYPGAMYGIEGTDIADTKVAKMAAAVMDSFRSKMISMMPIVFQYADQRYQEGTLSLIHI